MPDSDFYISWSGLDEFSKRAEKLAERISEACIGPRPGTVTDQTRALADDVRALLQDAHTARIINTDLMGRQPEKYGLVVHADTVIGVEDREPGEAFSAIIIQGNQTRTAADDFRAAVDHVASVARLIKRDCSHAPYAGNVWRGIMLDA